LFFTTNLDLSLTNNSVGRDAALRRPRWRFPAFEPANFPNPPAEAKEARAGDNPAVCPYLPSGLDNPTTFPPMREFHALCVKFSRLAPFGSRPGSEFIGLLAHFSAGIGIAKGSSEIRLTGREV
jgi:hypothetical protein